MDITIPVISVIIPTYNRGELLEKALLSVVNQKQDIPYDREVIIVDDGSLENPQRFIQSYLDQYPDKIHYISQHHSGIPGVGRNRGLDAMRKDSTYTIFLDDDDEFTPDLFAVCLQKRQDLKNTGTYESVLGFYFLCKNERGEVIGNKKILQGKQERIFTYNDYLQGAINVEMLLLTKSYIYFQPLSLRFSEEVITEGVMRSKMRQYMDKYGLKILLRDYIGRVYKVYHTSETQVTKIISQERFFKNAQGNEHILEIIGSDLLFRGYKNAYADLLYRSGINYVLSGHRKRGLILLNQSLHYNFTITILLVYVLALFPKSLLIFLYKLSV